MANAKMFYLMVPKVEAERRYDPMDLENALERDGWVGVVSASRRLTLKEIAIDQRILTYKILEVN